MSAVIVGRRKFVDGGDDRNIMGLFTAFYYPGKYRKPFKLPL